MKLFALSLGLLLLTSCIDNNEFHAVNYESLFNDGNSKVWMLNKVMVGDKNFAPKLPNDKDIVIFYNSGKCYFQALKKLGTQAGKKGEYSVYSSDKKITLYFQNEKWDFKIVSMEENKVILAPTKESDLSYKLEIIPLPELNF
ncbi:MAG: hypothetical protein V4638_06315 [Bacteroidota bacterium]